MSSSLILVFNDVWIALQINEDSFICWFVLVRTLYSLDSTLDNGLEQLVGSQINVVVVIIIIIVIDH